jgi:hypothetical protein
MFTFVDLYSPYINIFKPARQEWKMGICPYLNPRHDQLYFHSRIITQILSAAFPSHRG